MSKYFPIRHPLQVSVGGQRHTYYIRELGYLEFDELRHKTISSLDGDDKEQAGVALMTAVVLASVEEENGQPSYTADEWRLEVRDVVLEIGKAALRAQHLDLDKIGGAPPMTEEEAEGNAEPSRKSGVNSRSASAAQSVN